MKCAFGVTAENIFGFIVHENGVVIDPKKIKSIQDLQPPKCKKDMQKLLGNVNSVRRLYPICPGR
jgi:hypothetical protein